MTYSKWLKRPFLYQDDQIGSSFWWLQLFPYRAVQESLLGSLTSDLVLGGGVSEVVDEDVTLGVQMTLLDNEINSKTSGDVIAINFGSELSGM